MLRFKISLRRTDIEPVQRSLAPKLQRGSQQELVVKDRVGDNGDAEVDADARERRGRRWLMWSFILFPCHLPISMAVLAVIFGGSAFGALISRNTLGVGIIFGALYAAGVAVGFRHLRAAAKGRNCSGGSCEI
ncbi:MAG: hypothetical protein ACN4GZ_16930 [Acidimicrobiales bacterium]